MLELLKQQLPQNLTLCRESTNDWRREEGERVKKYSFTFNQNFIYCSVTEGRKFSDKGSREHPTGLFPGQPNINLRLTPMSPYKVARYHHMSIAVTLLPDQDSTCLPLKLPLSPSSNTPGDLLQLGFTWQHVVFGFGSLSCNCVKQPHSLEVKQERACPNGLAIGSEAEMYPSSLCCSHGTCSLS